MYFMSVEVHGHAYFYTARDQDEDVPDITSLDLVALFRASHAAANPEASERLRRDMKAAETRAQSFVPFRYNPLHDMESLWWVALFLLLAGTLVDAGPNSADTTNDQKVAQQRLSEQLFCDKAFRINAFITDETLQSHLFSLHPRIAEIGIQLEKMRSHLTQGFRQAEKNITKPIPFALPPSLYQKIQNLFRKIIDSLAADNVLVAVDEKSCRRLREEIRKQKEGDAAAAETAQTESDTEDAPPAKRRKAVPPPPLSYSSRGHALSQLRRSHRIASRPNTAPK